MGKLSGLALVLLIVVIIVILVRLPDDAMVLATGVVLGILAMIPALFLTVWALGRRGQSNDAPDKQRGQMAPPAVFYFGQTPQQWRPPEEQPALPSPTRRDFHMVGEEWKDEEE